MDKIDISIIMLAYNHEKFIAKAIDGILMQQTDFTWELLIADDCSTDGTGSVCRQYAGKDSRIKYHGNEHNLGANANFLNIYGKCRGEYIALCEGDDYWIDPAKLEKQVNFLQNNPGFVSCFHDVYELKNEILEPNSITYQKSEFDIVDLAHGNIIHTPSVVFRNFGEKIIPAYFASVYVGDYLLHMQLARFGKVKYLDEKMAVYRIHAGGAWSTRKDEFIYIKIADYLEKLLSDNFSQDVKKILKARLSGAYQNLYNITRKPGYLLKLIKRAPYGSLKYLLHKTLYAAG